MCVTSILPGEKPNAVLWSFKFRKKELYRIYLALNTAVLLNKSDCGLKALIFSLYSPKLPRQLSPLDDWITCHGGFFKKYINANSNPSLGWYLFSCNVWQLISALVLLEATPYGARQSCRMEKKSTNNTWKNEDVIVSKIDESILYWKEHFTSATLFFPIIFKICFTFSFFTKKWDGGEALHNFNFKLCAK